MSKIGCKTDDMTGATHLSWLGTEVFRECYKEDHPYDDFIKITFRNCQIVSPVFSI
jgi:anaphase-promoting complex subunit 5